LKNYCIACKACTFAYIGILRLVIKRVSLLPNAFNVYIIICIAWFVKEKLFLHTLFGPISRLSGVCNEPSVLDFVGLTRVVCVR